jgi:hypothetical protein
MLGHGLCDAENDYLRERQTFCLKTMEEILKDNAPSGNNLVLSLMLRYLKQFLFKNAIVNNNFVEIVCINYILEYTLYLFIGCTMI